MNINFNPSYPQQNVTFKGVNSTLTKENVIKAVIAENKKSPTPLHAGELREHFQKLWGNITLLIDKFSNNEIADLYLGGKNETIGGMVEPTTELLRRVILPSRGDGEIIRGAKCMKVLGEKEGDDLVIKMRDVAERLDSKYGADYAKAKASHQQPPERVMQDIAAFASEKPTIEEIEKVFGSKRAVVIEDAINQGWELERLENGNWELAIPNETSSEEANKIVGKLNQVDLDLFKNGVCQSKHSMEKAILFETERQAFPWQAQVCEDSSGTGYTIIRILNFKRK